MSTVSLYQNVKSHSSLEVELNSIFKAIKEGKWKNLSEEYRAKKDKSIKVEKVPAVTVSGTFPDKRKASMIDQHSGFIAMDFDEIENLPELFYELSDDPYTYALFRSISGQGLCAIVKINGSKHKESFEGLERYYLQNYSVGVDPSCKDVSRLRFVSYDPALVINQNSQVFKDYIKKPKGRKAKVKPVFSSNDDVEFVIKQIEAKKIDITADYSTWVEIAFALYSEYGEAGEEYFHRVSQFHPDYDERQTSIKYKSARGGGAISISTFFHYAKLNGLDITTPKSKTIQRSAIYARKGGRTQEQVISQLKEVDGIDPSESKDIVKKVFEAESSPELETDDDLIGQLEDWIRRERQILYNEVTLKYEENGVPLVDRDFNTIFLDAKKIISKASKDLVFTVIDSDRTKTVNPLQDFFKQYSNRKPKGLIEKLAETINTPTGMKGTDFMPDFAHTFIKKWMVGAVAMWHGKHSPLMLVLVGSKQNTGKTHWFRYLLPDELRMYYAESELTGDKDENLLMCNKALIMNDEMSNKSRKDITIMKQLCSKQYFNLRKPYGKSNEDFRRIATLAGTSNSLEILSDPTGNRRILPIEVESIDHDKYNSIDKIDLWVEAYDEFMNGYQFALTNDDIHLLNSHTFEFEEPSPEGELIMKFFRVPDKNDITADYMTNTEIKAYCEVRTQQKLSNRKLGLELKSLGFEQTIRKHEGRVQRLYHVLKTDA